MGVGSIPSLAVHPITHIMYAGGGAGVPNVYTINTATAAATLVGDSGLGFAAIGAMDFRADGALFAAVNIVGDGGSGSDHLATIDKTTGVATVIGPFGTCPPGGLCTIEGMEAMAFSPSGTLYGAVSSRGPGSTPGLYTINMTTGAATFVAAILDSSSTPPSGGIVSLQFDCDGTLFGGTARAVGAATDGGRLVTIEPRHRRLLFRGRGQRDRRQQPRRLGSRQDPRRRGPDGAFAGSSLARPEEQRRSGHAVRSHGGDPEERVARGIGAAALHHRRDEEPDTGEGDHRRSGRFPPPPFATGDVLSLRVSTRIGTNPDGTKCAGPGGSHNNALGLRLYYDAASRRLAVRRDDHAERERGLLSPLRRRHLPQRRRRQQGSDNANPRHDIAPVAANPRCKDSGSSSSRRESLLGGRHLEPCLRCRHRAQDTRVFDRCDIVSRTICRTSRRISRAHHGHNGSSAPSSGQFTRVPVTL